MVHIIAQRTSERVGAINFMMQLFRDLGVESGQEFETGEDLCLQVSTVRRTDCLYRVRINKLQTSISPFKLNSPKPCA